MKNNRNTLDRPKFIKGPAKGTLRLKVFGRTITLTGGPYAYKPEGMLGVKMAAEIDLPADLKVDTEDFRTPPLKVLKEAVVSVLIGASALNKRYYVGCMAGQGRTGLFLACCVAVSGVKDPVEYVRDRYYPHAVETLSQEMFVEELPISELREQLMGILVAIDAIDFNWLLAMSWSDRWLFLKTKFL